MLKQASGIFAAGEVAPLGPGAGGDRPLSDAYALIRPSLHGSLLLALCVFVGMVEGYDVQAMSLAAPLLARMWNLAPPAVGTLLSISLIGQVFGGFLLAPLGDRLGRRTSLLIGLVIAGCATYAGAFMPDYASMMVVRFIAGIGLGFALANTMTLAMELVPGSWRSIAVVLVSAGYPLGAATGAGAVGLLLADHGVAAVFYVGGAGTLIAFLLCIALLPESPVMMLRRSADQAAVRRVFGRLGVAIDPAVRLTGHAERADRSNVAALFTPERRSSTLLLWALMFCNLSLIYFFVMWMPSLFVHSGLDPRDAIRATALFNFSGIAGGITFAVLLPRIGPIATLGSCYALTIASVALFAAAAPPSAMFFGVLVLCGFMICGSQFCLHAVINLFYPGPIRVTGLGFASSAGRIGGVVAPLAGGYILTRLASPADVFYFALIPAVLCLGTLLALRSLKLVGLRSE